MITEVGFYHLTQSPLDRALPTLLEKVVDRGLRAVLVVRDPDRLTYLDRVLWTYRPDSFLPHGSKTLGHAERQAIWLTDTVENPNGGTVLVTVDGLLPPVDGPFARLLDLFEGGDAEAVAAARDRWRHWRNQAGVALAYWQQTDRGWQKAQSTGSA